LSRICRILTTLPPVILKRWREISWAFSAAARSLWASLHVHMMLEKASSPRPAQKHASLFQVREALGPDFRVWVGGGGGGKWGSRRRGGFEGLGSEQGGVRLDVSWSSN